jgi:hypothetical protein
MGQKAQSFLPFFFTQKADKENAGRAKASAHSGV